MRLIETNQKKLFNNPCWRFQFSKQLRQKTKVADFRPLPCPPVMNAGYNEVGQLIIIKGAMGIMVKEKRTVRVFGVAVVVGLVAVFALIPTGCGSSSTSGSPGQAVLDFWASIFEKDTQEAYELMSASDQKELSFQELEDILAEDTPEEDIDVELISEDITGNTATVMVAYQGNEMSFRLVKEDGDWKLKGIATIITKAAANAAEGACRDNLRTLEGTIMLYEAGTGSYPQSFEELIPDYIKEMPVCREGGTYSMSIGTNGPEVSCSVHGSLYNPKQ